MKKAFLKEANKCETSQKASKSIGKIKQKENHFENHSKEESHFEKQKREITQQRAKLTRASFQAKPKKT